jgi:hypothetical protein
VAVFNYALTPGQVLDLWAASTQRLQPKLTVSLTAGRTITIRWDGQGTLQSTPSLQSSLTIWTNVSTTSPVTITSSGKAMFYRVMAP